MHQPVCCAALPLAQKRRGLAPAPLWNDHGELPQRHRSHAAPQRDPAAAAAGREGLHQPM